MEPQTPRPRKRSYAQLTPRENAVVDYDSSLTILIGTAIIIGAYIVCTFFLYWIVFSKLLPYTGHPVLDWLKDDHFYCVLFPVLFGPIVVFIVYFNWLAMKYFRHS